MTRTKPTPSILTIAVVCLSLISGGNVLSTEQDVITDDGREVLLKDDGTWAFRSTDRFANTKDGRRVRLKQDGSWQYVGNAAMISAERVRTTHLDINLEKVVIEKYEKKVQKNVRVKTQTVFYLNLDLSPLAQDSVKITEKDIAQIEVKDNNGKSYPVLAIQPSPTILEPNSKTAVVVRAKGAPTWLGSAKSMSVIFNPGVFGINNPITLRQSVDDFEEEDVEGFEKE